MAETRKSIPIDPSVAKVFVFMNEYSFRVEPGFVVAHAGDRLEFRNLTVFGVVLKFEHNFYAEPVSLAPDACEGFEIPKEVRLGFHPYTATVGIGERQSLNAIGGSDPGVIITP